MKYTALILFLIALSGRMTYAQTAVDFTATDCQGSEINLYDELNVGKVVVIVWIMPCGSCIGPAKTAFNVAKSFKDSHPGRVTYFLVDDYANSTCNSITNWASTNNIQPTSVFSTSVIKMSDYGSDGMPKVVVLAGTEHKVLFNKKQ